MAYCKTRDPRKRGSDDRSAPSRREWRLARAWLYQELRLIRWKGGRGRAATYPRSCSARDSDPSDTAMTAAVVRVRREAVA
jgi:hypothetical protein